MAEPASTERSTRRVTRERFRSAVTAVRALFSDSNETKGNVFSSEEVWSRERTLIERRRQARRCTTDGRSATASLTGLSLSGGGIRSATFCLGVLQELQRAKVLRAFDYLSTVSGGGFIGGWWTAWIHRNPLGEFPADEQIAPDRPQAMRPRDAESLQDFSSAGTDPIHHLRLYSNYLTPRKGLLSEDTWRAVTIIIRNLLLTWAVLLPFLFAVVLIADFYYVVADDSWLDPNGVLSAKRFVVWLAPVAAFLGWLAVSIVTWLEYARSGRFTDFIPRLSLSIFVILLVALTQSPPASGTAAAQAAGGNGVGTALQLWFAFFVSTTPGRLIGAWLITAIALYSTFCRNPEHLADIEMRNRLLQWQVRFLVIAAMLLLVLGGGGLGHELVRYLLSSNQSASWLEGIVKSAGGPLVVLSTIAGALYTAFQAAPSAASDARNTATQPWLGRLAFKLTPPLVLIVLLIATSFAAHWAMVRLTAPSNIPRSMPTLSIGLGIFAITLAMYAWDESGTIAFDIPTRLRARRAVVGVFACILLAAVLSAQGHNTIVRMGMGVILLPVLSISAAVPRAVLAVLMATALIGAVKSAGLRGTFDNHRPAWCLAAAFFMVFVALFFDFFGMDRALIAAGFLGTVLAWIVTFGWLVDPNEIGLHSFYRGRLVRAYLGASNQHRARMSKTIMDADTEDDVTLSSLGNDDVRGPYHLVNTTLNLVGGRDLTSAQRSSDRFLLSPLFCGSSRTKYRDTSAYMSNRLTLGGAMAVSGAAVSPTMGSLSPTASVSALMTLLNVRLGYWAPTPNKSGWQKPTASLWPVYAIREMTSQTNELTTYSYLTDGGHFDNTGLYSLIERGCRNILLVDCGADARPSFGDLGGAIRRCRIDFGTNIDIDLAKALKPASEGRHFLVGTIEYSAAHAQAIGLDDADRKGVLIVIKPRVLHVDETADVRQYQFTNDSFPQQQTADQWFDEAQFESYRKLGELSARSLITMLNAPLKGLQNPAFSVTSVNAVFDAAAAL